jgi:hypothetical protein
MTLPCECGLAPERLSGLLDEAMDGAPCSETGSTAQEGRGLPPIASLAGFTPAGN